MSGTGKTIAIVKAVGVSASEVSQEIERQLPGEVSDWLGKHITNPDSPPLDRSLTQSNAATPADITGELKSALAYAEEETETVTEQLTLTWSPGYVTQDGTVFGGTTYEYSNRINVNPGDTIKLYRETLGTEVDQCRFIAVYKDNAAVQSLGGENVVLPYTVPDGADQIIISILAAFGNATGDKSYTVTTETLYPILKPDVDELKEDVETIKNNDTDIVEWLTFSTSQGYMDQNGNVGGTSDGSRAYTSKIQVTPGDIIRTVPIANSKSVIMRFICAYSGDTIVPAKGVESVPSYTVPEGIDGVVISGFTATEGDSSTIPNIFKFTKGKAPGKSNTNALTTQGNLADGNSFVLPIINVSKNRIIAFDAIINTFSAIKIGRTGFNNAIRIDGTNVELLNSSGNVANTYPHGLTIANNISVRIVHDIDFSDNKLRVYVSSNGVNSSPIEITWSQPTNEKPKVTSIGSTLTDCTFSYSATDINKKIRGYGDSYFSNSDSRWIGQLKNYGYMNNIMLNAYSGESAAQNIPALLNVIDKGDFQFVLWANGMNDGSDGSAPNNFWLNAINVVLTACKSRGIIPILATIPTVPSINNEYKNAWIRNSGYRYIDFAKAVGANSSGIWYSGMLSNDEVHPTELGAIALCNRALADCPELMQKS